jgi:predicted amidohydrolase YtcJ
VNRTARAALRNARSPGVVRHASESGTKGNTAVASLDPITAAPDTPVLVPHLYQSAILNRAAITALGYTKDTPDPPGGQIVRDHAGNPTGVLLATPAP